jgi:alanyl-tRNA synthetase
MKTKEIRQRFLDYFVSKDHILEPSSSLIPHNDKTLLFVNSGMVPFKNIFNGLEKIDYKRIVSCQTCVRAGGKHNDLENVGYTARHHTFFEMLGNFSFGDYFKREAIIYSWDFLTVNLGIPKERLWVSVFENDDEAENIWINEIGFPKSKISRCGAKDNFWQMGNTGPCGPCSEIFYDYGDHIYGGPPGHADEDGDRYTEIWNLVFTQYDKQEDGYLKPLDAPCVDTGMGLERIASVLQNKNNNYDTDIFKELIKKIISFTDKEKNIKTDNSSVRVIADHIRSVVFMIADGVIPSNEGRGYVLRRIIRRAIRHGHNIGINKLFFYLLAPVLALDTKDIYPKIKNSLANIEKIIKNEESKFIKTLDQGLKILQETIASSKSTKINGDIVFKLYDTYGFPVDMTADIARENNLSIDIPGFEAKMSKQKHRARKTGDFNSTKKTFNLKKETDFLGYQQLENTSAITAIIKDGKLVDTLVINDEAIIILDKTSFYAESGGQVGDIGVLVNKKAEFIVNDTQQQPSKVFEHYGKLKTGTLKIGDKLEAKVNINHRKAVERNHSATHLLHAALKEVLSENIAQKGSLVDSNKLRFDFSYDDYITKKDLLKIESIVNDKILENTKVNVDITDIKTAKKIGAVALFGEKYGDKVRVLTMGKNDFSIELCGGTHVEYLGSIGPFRIVYESGVSAGVRRIEAVTGDVAYQFDKNIADDLSKIADIAKTNNNKVVEKVSKLIKQQKDLEKQIAQLQKQLTLNKSEKILTQAIEINDIKFLATKIQDVDAKDLRYMIDKLKDKLLSAVIILATVKDGRVLLVAGVTKNLITKYNAGKIVSHVASKIDGKGGGRADMAQGGGTQINKLDAALSSVRSLL